MGKVVEIDCEKSMKLETSRNVTKSKRSLHWCRSISKKYLCTFYYSISQKVITLSGRRFITVSGVLLHYRAFYYIIGQLLQYRAFITLSVGTTANTKSKNVVTVGGKPLEETDCFTYLGSKINKAGSNAKSTSGLSHAE